MRLTSGWVARLLMAEPARKDRRATRPPARLETLEGRALLSHVSAHVPTTAPASQVADAKDTSGPDTDHIQDAPGTPNDTEVHDAPGVPNDTEVHDSPGTPNDPEVKDGRDSEVRDSHNGSTTDNDREVADDRANGAVATIRGGATVKRDRERRDGRTRGTTKKPVARRVPTGPVKMIQGPRAGRSPRIGRIR